MTQVSEASAGSYPWRRGPEYSQSNTLSVEAPVFVPSWEEPRAQPAPGNYYCNMISLGAYSDDSDSSSDEEKPKTTLPAAAVAEMEAGAEESTRSRRPWRVSAPEFVPRASAPEFVPQGMDTVEDATLEEDVSAGQDKPEPADKCVAPWRRTPSGSPIKAESSNTLSTSEGTSPSSPATSSNDASSVSSASRSRSPTPPPAAKEEEVVSGLHALLRWRTAAPSEELKLELPVAGVPEPGTEYAAVAAYVAAEALKPLKETPSTEKSSPSMSRRRSEDAPATMSWRRNSEDSLSPVASEEKSKRSSLTVSDDGWVARQAARRRTKSNVSGETEVTMSDEDIVRAMKSILNKLTVEKFESLSVQLIHCGIRNTFHLELLIQEVFEKATTQHHFIDMYADLCDLLNVHFSEHAIIDDAKKGFKKVLLHCCQASFEKHLQPPKGLAALNAEDRAVAERAYKMRMLGNIRFVGALLVRKMLASKVMLAIMEELLQDPSNEALESLAALLTVVGPTFDTPDWAYRVTLNAIFTQVEQLTKKTSVDSRARCLLQDVLDIRNSGWKDRRPKKIEGPLKLKQVADKAAMETGNWVSQKAPSAGNDWETVGKERVSKLCSILNNNKERPAWMGSPCTLPTSTTTKQQVPPPQKVEKTTKGTGAGAAMLAFLRTREEPAEPVPEPKQEKKAFDRASCETEIALTLAELRVSYDVKEAIVRVAEINIPVHDQSTKFVDILSKLVEEGTEGARKAGFDVVAGLILEGHWKAESAALGIESFIETTCPDLMCDVPALPQILQEELHPSLEPVVKAGLLKADLQNALLSI